MRKKISFEYGMQKGQTMLIVVLAIVIALTVGLSVASRSITNLKTTTEEISSQKALSAAEAGIERAIQKLTSSSVPIEGTFDLGTSFSATISALSGKRIVLNGGNGIEKDQGIDLWLVGHNPDGTPNYSSPWSGTIAVYWGDQEDQCVGLPADLPAALEIVVVYVDPTSSTLNSLKRYTVDPCSVRAAVNQLNKPDDKLPDPGDTVEGKQFPYSRENISITNGLVARIVPLYVNTPVAVVADKDLPSQGAIINSVGKSGSTQRKVTVFQGYPSLPSEYFPNNFFYHNL